MSLSPILVIMAMLSVKLKLPSPTASVRPSSDSGTSPSGVSDSDTSLNDGLICPSTCHRPFSGTTSRLVNP